MPCFANYTKNYTKKNTDQQRTEKKQKTEKKKLVQDAAVAEEQASILRRQLEHVEGKVHTMAKENEHLK